MGAKTVPAGSLPGALGAYVSAFGGHKGVAGVTLKHTAKSWAQAQANAKARWSAQPVNCPPAALPIPPVVPQPAVGCAAVGGGAAAQPIIIKVPVPVPVPVRVPAPPRAPRYPVVPPVQPCNVPAAPPACGVPKPVVYGR